MASWIKKISDLNIVSDERLLELYPPFFFMGVKIKEVSEDHRKMKATLPFRWYGKNIFGTMFGGFMCAVSDPLPALMCGKIFPNCDVWTKNNSVEFLTPARSDLHLEIDITQEDIELIRENLSSSGKTSYWFEFYFTDKRGAKIAFVRNQVYLKERKASQIKSPSKDLPQ